MPILDWLNKKEALTTADKTPYKILVENKDLSVGDQAQGNMLIKGDNLEVLKALLPYYKGRVKCIYIDPPYNTGSAFDHYDDNLEHSIWLSLIYPRLELLRELLHKDGIIFVQIDDKEQAYLKVIMDEIFGRDNFMTMLTIETGEVFGTKAAHIDKTFVKVKDYIMVYKRFSNSNINLKPLYTKTNEPFDPHYSSYIDPISLTKTPLLTFLKKQRWIVELFSSLNYKIQLENISKVMLQNKKFNDYIIQDLSKNIYQDQPLSRQPQESENLKPGEIANLSGNLIFKTSTGSLRYYMPFSEALHWTSDFISEFCRSTVRGNLWKNYHIDMRNIADEGDVKFKNSKKPERLIRDILDTCTNPGDLVLDSFLESGTTAAVAQKMGRKYIGIEMGEHAITHCVPRMKKVIDGTDQGGISKALGWTGGGGFTFYDLGQPIFDTTGNINQGISFKDLAFHVWFSETKTPMQSYQYSPLLGVHQGTAFYLLYNGVLGDKRVNGGNVLTSKILEGLPPFDGPKVIYGESCRLSPQRLKKENIVFKQTPYAISAR